jgi:YHS domain-containing protein
VKGPEPYLNAFEARFTCPVTKNEAKPDSALRVMLNHEIFYLADAKARDRFRNQPLRWCGTLTDPVSRARFQPTSRSPRMVWQGRSFYFASDSTRGLFAAMPDSFAWRRGM